MNDEEALERGLQEISFNVGAVVILWGGSCCWCWLCDGGDGDNGGVHCWWRLQLQLPPQQ